MLDAVDTGKHQRSDHPFVSGRAASLISLGLKLVFRQD